MKKLVSLILALSLVFALAISASATAATFPAVTDAGKITIQKATAGTTYTLYRILDIAKVVPGKSNVYIMNDKWADFIKTSGLEISGNYIVSVPDNVADAQKLAEAVVAYAKANNIANDGSSKMIYSGDHASSNLRQYGYYVMASDREGAGVKYTVFVIDQSHVTIEEKNSSVASLQKFVQEDSQAGDVNTYGWGESNAAEIAQPVNFKIVVTLNPGTDTIRIEDTMEHFRDIQNLAVEYSGGDIAEGTAYSVNTTEGVDNATFTVTLLPDFRKVVEADNTLTITYNAKMRNTANIGSTGNVNTAVLYSDDQAVSTDTTTTFTYRLNVTKVNEVGNALEGATFELLHKDVPLNFTKDGNNYIVSKQSTDTVTQITTDTTGKFSICGLDTEDKYVLHEVAAPQGYILMDDESVLIRTGAATDEEVTVTNLPGVVMPETGGMGTTLFYVLGIILVCGAAVLLVSKKRMSAN